MNESFLKSHNQSDEDEIKLQTAFANRSLNHADSHTNSPQPHNFARVALRLIMAIKTGDTDFLDQIRKMYYKDLKD